jgi:23S rRNA (cytosine1962-C5)-methyltransferase
MEPTLPTLTLRPGEADRIIAGHPWIYAGSISKTPTGLEDGSMVAVKDHRGRLVGSGFYNARSKIRIRMLSPDIVAADQAFFESRLTDALALRRRYLPEATSFRVVNAESDQLSGLIVDKYEDVLVVQTSSLGMDQRKPLLVAALQRLLSPRAIVERNDAAFRRFEGLEDANGPLLGSVAGPIPVQLNGLQFEADPAQGHKTGLYLDQQLNYRAVAELLRCRPGARVLDAFTFQGGFALHAARAGAAHVLGIDQSEDAVRVASRLAQENGFGDRCTFEAANAFDWLSTRTAKPIPDSPPLSPWDVVILDPPSFTRTRAALPDALRGYKEIHLRSLKLLRAGGLLVTFCCSHHVDAGTFLDVILSAAFDARRLLRRVAVFSQSPDHPVIPCIAETEYLKGFAFEIVR